MKILMLAVILCVAGCGMENGEIVTSDAQRAKIISRTQKRGEARLTLFKECLVLASKITRQADDDVSDIVKECSSQAYYATNYLE